jgi:hypothetical protein
MRLAAQANPISLRVCRSIRAKGGQTPRGPRVGHGRSNGDTFRAGEEVKQSGIYEVIHDGAHRVAHDVVMLSGDVFPPCETCDERVRFQLIRTAPYIFQDADFEEEK